MENSFTQKSKGFTDKELLERIYYPECFVVEAVGAAIEEVNQRNLKNVDFSRVDALRLKLEKKKRKEVERKRELELLELQNTKDSLEKIQQGNFANFGYRILASVLDLIFGTIFAFVFIGILYPITKFLGEGSQYILNDVIFMVILWLYFVSQETSSERATFGKSILKLKVVDTKGGRLDFKKATLRFLSKILSVLILGIGLIKALFSSTNQSLHDDIVGTYVIR